MVVQKCVLSAITCIHMERAITAIPVTAQSVTTAINPKIATAMVVPMMNPRAILR